MSTDAEIKLFKGNINCDRNHLLSINRSVDDSSTNICYEEVGNAFNGFNEPFILNTNYDLVKSSRIAEIKLKGMNLKLNEQSVMEEFPIYCLINNIQPLRNNKTYVSLEPDAWLNYRNDIVLGNINTLFETTELLTNYPYYEYTGKYKYFYNMQKLEDVYSRYVIILWHSAVDNFDYTIVIHCTVNLSIYEFLFKVFNVIERHNYDTNQIISISLSPFNMSNITSVMLDVTTNEDTEDYCTVFMTASNLFNKHCIDHPTVKEVNIVCNPYEKTVITDMNGSIVWQAVHMNNGTKYLKYVLNASPNMVYWDFVIQDTNDANYIEVSPNKRFSIVCNGIPFFADYYQQYMNTERSFNIEKRQAQLDKQLIDGIGDTAASTLWHGTSSGAPKKDATGIAKYFPATSMIATAGAAIGGGIQTGLEWYSTGDYFKRLNDIENRQAKVQYDKLIASSDSIVGYTTKRSLPSIGSLRVDVETVNSKHTFGDLNIKYNCPINKIDLNTLLFSYNDHAKYISGDFDFCSIPVMDALQLNTRFKGGVEFVDWT